MTRAGYIANMEGQLNSWVAGKLDSWIAGWLNSLCAYSHPSWRTTGSLESWVVERMGIGEGDCRVRERESPADGQIVNCVVMQVQVKLNMTA